MLKKALLLCILAPLLALGAAAGEFRDKGETIAVDFPAGWAAGKSDDPAVTLRLERGKAFFEFSKQESELGDYYLKARVKEQVDSLRSKGTTLTGDVRPAGIRGVSTAYYTSYESLGAESYIAFFTYNSASYAISARGLSDSEFRGVLNSVRKPGEKIELPKPKKVRVVRKKKEPEEDFSTQIFKDGDAEVSTAAVAASTDILGAFSASTAAPAAAEVSTAPAAAEAAGQAAQHFLAELAKKREGDAGLPPYIPRQPLPFAVWGVLMGLWIAGAFAARGMAASYRNPKLPPPPADVPPDFFFPFVISRSASLKDVTYQIVTRQKQRLMAEYASEHDVYLAAGVYGCVLFHAAWSLLALAGSGDAVVNILLRVPLAGRALASLPEIFFLVPLAAGIFHYFSKRRDLQLYDAQNNLVLEVKPEITYGLLRDGNGKEVARLVRKGTFLYRYWEFVDTDNLVVFSIRDDFPKGYLLSRLFGNLGGALRLHYGIFAQDRRAGFVFLDPTSADRFQVHMDFAFARLGHPAHILAAVLYVISKEKNPPYPSL